MDSFFWVILMGMLHDSREPHVCDINILITTVYQMIHSFPVDAFQGMLSPSS